MNSKKKWGLVDYYEEVTKGCIKIYTVGDLISYFDDIANNKDTLKQERNKLCKMVNCSTVGDNTSRVTDFIIEKIEERFK